jgi:2-dehydro-3-deoxyphosphogluconate aldolase/(4S)-4-hydroxy-2-oxoglutarate aldolase
MNELLADAGVVPVVVFESAADAVPVATALRDGGLPVIEVTLRTAAATEAIRRIADQVPDIAIGAGTVLDAEQVAAAANAGARFIVSPGLHESVVDEAQSRQLPVYPGVSTATEAQAAWNLGLRTLKFFPAIPAGGVPMLKALSSVFRDLQFMPTGGVTAANLVDFLQLSSVIACGGSWLTPAESIAAKDYGAIRQLAEQARALVMDLQGSDQ